MCIKVVVFVLPNPTSKEIREKIIHHKQNYVNETDIAKWLVISQSTVTKVWALHKKTGSIKPRPRTQGRKPQVSQQTMDQITQKIEQTPDTTLKELIHEFNLQISPAALSKRLIKLGYTFKKKSFHPKEQEKPTVIKSREVWRINQPNLEVAKLVFLDESSINLAYTRLYGRAKLNQRIHEGIKDVRFKRQFIVSTVRLSGEKVAFVFEGTLNKELFAQYLRICLVPTLGLGGCVGVG